MKFPIIRNTVELSFDLGPRPSRSGFLAQIDLPITPVKQIYKNMSTDEYNKLVREQFVDIQ